MMRFILSLPLLFQAVNGAARASITPAADLEMRQQQILSTVWGPVLNQGTVSYKLYPCSAGSTLAASGTQWNCCATSGSCFMPTTCSSGTVFGAGTSLVCSSVFSNTATSRCGTDVLASSVGDSNKWNKIFCAGPTDSLTEFYFIQSPTSLSSTTPSSPVPTTPTPSPEPEKSHTPIGAIVGGVVGGIAMIALIVAGVFLMFRRRKSSSTAPATQPEVQQQYPPSGGHDSKHASYASAYPTGAPGSPPPMYQNNAANQAHFGHSEMGAPATAAYEADNKAPFPSPGGRAPSAYQHQYAAPAPAAGAYEMSTGSPTAYRGAVELPVAGASGTR